MILVIGSRYTYKQISFTCNIVSTVGEYSKGIIVGKLKDGLAYNPYLVFNRITNGKELKPDNEIYMLVNKINSYGA